MKPEELLGPVKLSDDCYVTQTESVHVIQSNGGMFATDIACKFGAVGGKGGRAEVYAPDLRGKSTKYFVEFVGRDELLGSFIQLRVIDDKKYDECNSSSCADFLSDESFYLGHTETKFKQGDIVSTGQRIGQMTLNGATTGWHVHFEYRRLSPGGTWASQRYFTGQREKALDNKRKNVTFTGWKWGDTIYATSYDLGDVNQNDSSPFIGASGKDLRHIYRPVALTKDVRRSLGIKWGDSILIENIATGIVYDVTVEDEMNMRYRETGPGNCIKPNGGKYCIKMDIADKKIPAGAYKLISKNTVGQP